MASDADLLVVVRGKKFRVSPADVTKLHKAVGKGWTKTIQNYEQQMKSVHAIWKTHYDLREEYFFTSRVLQAATSAYFPTQADLQIAEKEIANLRAAAAAGKLDGIQKANEQCYKWVSNISKSMDLYTKAMVSSSSNLVAATEFTRDASKDIVEVLLQVQLAKAPGGAAWASGLSGGYNELLDQIEAAQSPGAPNIAVAAALVIKSGTSDALIKHFLSDGKFGKTIVDKLAGEAAKIAGKHITNKAAVALVEEMWKKQLDELISESLKQLVKAYTPGTKLTWDQALHNVFDAVLKKTGAAQILGKFAGQFSKVEEKAIEKIKKGAVQGVKLDDKKIEEQVKKMIEASIEKNVENAIKTMRGNVDNFANVLVDAIIKDSKFKTDVAKVAQKKGK